MKAKSFEYKGYTFKPIGNILGGFITKSYATTWAYKIEVKDYSHEDFYKVAKENHAACDVYEVEGKLYIPCNSCFLGVYGEPEIKKLEEYSRWYQ